MAGYWWTPEEFNILSTNYPKMPGKNCMLLLPTRTWRAIRCFAERYNIKRQGRAPRPDLGERNREPAKRELLSRRFKGRNLDIAREKAREPARQRLKRLNKDPEFTKRRLKGLLRRPTRPERELISIIKEYKLPYKYVGDGSITIEGISPDFIDVNGAKNVIEVFGDYWHGERARTWKQTELGREMLYNSYGFRCLVIWEHELSDRTKVLAKIQQFREVNYERIC